MVPSPWKAFVSEELMLVPEDTDMPPDYVQEWQYLSSWIDITHELSYTFNLVVMIFFQRHHSYRCLILSKPFGGLEQNL